MRRDPTPAPSEPAPSALRAAFGAALGLIVSACLAAGPRPVVAAAHGDVRGADVRLQRLVDQRGAPFTLAQLRGRPAFITFIATRCTDACPLADAVFARLAQRIRREHLRASLVTITLDPEHDTPFVMARAAHELDADPREWRLASGEPAAIHALMRAFGVVARADAAGIPDVHSTLVYVLDERVRLTRTLLLSAGALDEALRGAALSQEKGASQRSDIFTAGASPPAPQRR